MVPCRRTVLGRAHLREADDAGCSGSDQVGTSATEIAGHLDALGLRYSQPDDQPNTFHLIFGVEHYRNPDGDDALFIVLVVEEGGDYLQIFAPGAFTVPAEHAPAFAQACAAIQFRTKLIQFEWWEAEGVVIPIVELPVEDGLLGKRQLERCIRGLTRLVDEFYDVLRLAAEGSFDSARIENPELARIGDDLSGLLDLLPADVLERALARARERS